MHHERLPRTRAPQRGADRGQGEVDDPRRADGGAEGSRGAHHPAHGQAVRGAKGDVRAGVPWRRPARAPAGAREGDPRRHGLGQDQGRRRGQVPHRRSVGRRWMASLRGLGIL